MTEIIDLKFARLVNDLDTFVETNIIPDSFLDGTFTVDELVNDYQVQLDEFRQGALAKILERFEKNICHDVASVRSQLRADYALAMNNLATCDAKFMFPTVLHKYRSGINPVRALYYDVILMSKHFDRDNPGHYWLIDLITDKKFNQEVIGALDTDLKSLSIIIEKYYENPSLSACKKNLPVELFHAVYTCEDFRTYRDFFESTKNWSLDDLG